MKEDTITSISKELMKRSGGGTYLEYAFKYAIEKGKRYDRVIFLTDSETFSTTSDYYKDYKKSFNPNLKTYTIQFSGTNSTMFNTKDPNNFIFAGYNDQVFKTIASELSPDKIIKLINEVSLEGQLI